MEGALAPAGGPGGGSRKTPARHAAGAHGITDFGDWDMVDQRGDTRRTLARQDLPARGLGERGRRARPSMRFSGWPIAQRPFAVHLLRSHSSRYFSVAASASFSSPSVKRWPAPSMGISCTFAFAAFSLFSMS